MIIPTFFRFTDRKQIGVIKQLLQTHERMSTGWGVVYRKRAAALRAAGPPHPTRRTARPRVSRRVEAMQELQEIFREYKIAQHTRARIWTCVSVMVLESFSVLLPRR